MGEEINEVYTNLKNSQYTDVYIMSNDKLKLHAYYYHSSDDAPIAIIFHGYKSNGLHDGGGGFKIFREKGYNILIPDQRAHGKSEGHTISFGVNERYDAAQWVRYCSERFGAEREIILTGVSMGAATILMASELELPGNVKGIIADCGYNSPKEIICKVMKTNFHLPPVIFYPLVRLSALLFGGFDPEKSSAEMAVKSSKYPILIIHGEEDTFVPYYMSKAIYDACSSKKAYLSIPGADHGISYMVDEKGYRKAVDKFLLENCTK